VKDILKKVYRRSFYWLWCEEIMDLKRYTRFEISGDHGVEMGFNARKILDNKLEIWISLSNVKADLSS
jgi:hypothetical protein